MRHILNINEWLDDDQLADKIRKFAEWSDGNTYPTKSGILEFLQNTDEDNSKNQRMIDMLFDEMNKYDPEHFMQIGVVQFLKDGKKDDIRFKKKGSFAC